MKCNALYSYKEPEVRIIIRHKEHTVQCVHHCRQNVNFWSDDLFTKTVTVGVAVTV